MKQLILLPSLLLFAFSLCAIDLGQSIDLAKKNNKNLLMAAEEISKADNSYKEVRAYLLPQLNLQGAYSLKTTFLPDSSIPGSFDLSSGLDTLATANDEYLAAAMNNILGSMIPSQTQKEGSLAMQLKLEQVLFMGGKLINGIKAVDRYRSIQKQRYVLTEQELIQKTIEIFYQCLLLEKLWKVQQDALATAQQHLNRVELLNREGQVSEFDMLRARLEVAKLSPQVLQAKNQYEIVIAAFQKQIGADANAIPEGQFSLPETINIELETAISEGLKNRIELNLADINTEIMQIRYNAEKGNYLPNVALMADYSLFTAADEYAIQSKDFGSQYSIGIGFQIPIFTGFSNSAKKAYAKHDYASAKLLQEDAEDMIELQIKQDHQRLNYARENYEVQEQNIRLAERGLELAQIRYENQVGIQLEVFDAQVMLSSVKLQYFQAIYELISADINLKKSIGYKL